MASATDYLDDAAAVGTSEATEMFVEFRCSSCYQIRHEPTRCCGDDVVCPYCQNANSVPAFDENTVRTAAQVAAASGSVTVEQGQFVHTQQSREELEALAKERAAKYAASNAYGEAALGTHSDIMTRAIAKIVDGVVLMVSLCLSLATGALLSKLGLCPTFDDVEPLLRQGDFLPPIFWVCYGGVHALVMLVIWWMTATLGQTPGKMMMGIKIVDGNGNPPGFLRGVVARAWVSGFVLGIIPFGGLANIGMAFYASPPRCIHDHMAGTYVVQS